MYKERNVVDTNKNKAFLIIICVIMFLFFLVIFLLIKELSKGDPNVGQEQPFQCSVMYGDVNCDGKINNDDLDYLQKYVNKSDDVNLSEQGLINADVYNDGIINVKDYSVLLKHLNKTSGYEVLPYSKK